MRSTCLRLRTLTVPRWSQVPVIAGTPKQRRCLHSSTGKLATRTNSVQQQAAIAVENSGSIDIHSYYPALDSRSINRLPNDDDSASDPSGTTGQVSRWIHETTIQDIDSKVLERAKYIILDGLACALTAAQLSESRIAVSSIASMESPGNCTVIGWNKVRSWLLAMYIWRKVCGLTRPIAYRTITRSSPEQHIHSRIRA